MPKPQLWTQIGKPPRLAYEREMLLCSITNSWLMSTLLSVQQVISPEILPRYFQLEPSEIAWNESRFRGSFKMFLMLALSRSRWSNATNSGSSLRVGYGQFRLSRHVLRRTGRKQRANPSARCGTVCLPSTTQVINVLAIHFKKG